MAPAHGWGLEISGSKPLTNSLGQIDGRIVEGSGETVHYALGGEYRAKTWYTGATYRHTSTPDARRLYGTSPELTSGRTGLGLLMLTIGARY